MPCAVPRAEDHRRAHHLHVGRAAALRAPCQRQGPGCRGQHADRLQSCCELLLFMFLFQLFIQVYDI